MNTDLLLDSTISCDDSATVKCLQALVSATIEAIGDAVITVDNNGNIDYVNAKAENLLQKNCAELNGRPFAAMVQIVNEHNHEQTSSVMAQGFCQTP